MNAFENFYSRIRDAKNAYDAAKTEDEKNAARAAYKAVWDELKELGTAACRLFRELTRPSGMNSRNSAPPPAAFSGNTRPPGTAATSISTSARWSGTTKPRGSSPLCGRTASRSSPSPPAGATQWKPPGFFRKPDAPLRDWWRSTAGTPNSAATSMRRPTGTFSESGLKAGVN